MSNVVIRQGVPLPRKDTKVKRTSPWHSVIEKMDVGDSVELPKKEAGLFVALARQSYKHMRFAVRQLSDTTNGIWRTL